MNFSISCLSLYNRIGCLASSLVYRYESLRDVVRLHEETYNVNSKKKGQLVKFTSPELVYIPFDAPIKDEIFTSTKLKRPIKANDILTFLDKGENRKYLTQKSKTANFEFNKKYKEVEHPESLNDLPIEENLRILATKFADDSELVEFDDQFSEGLMWKTQLVYAVVVNK